uniref:AlNc14C138G7156 protein n=1 Tax=Albugo laibachii Nc14 TaxID=890382 RepID=F0WKW6_9STRA|nr:AlNc14C138G7156 [Albugo laibachii Nc14]|eukprot:CCA21925.1 AlNc14C138G7156 [Albugo laibachii Nc14]
MQQWAQEQLGIALRRSTTQRIENMDVEMFMRINPSRKKSRSVKFPLFEKTHIEFILAKQDVICLSYDFILETALRLREQPKISESELQLSNDWLKTQAEARRRNVGHRKCEFTTLLQVIDVEKKGEDYFESLKAWMNTTNLTKWLRKFNLLMHERHALLLLDNASSHKAICKHYNVCAILYDLLSDFAQIMLLFFYVQGIIRSCKARYKKLFLRWRLYLVESNTVRKLTLLEAIEFSIARLIDAIFNAEFQSNNDYILTSIPFQQECAQLAELMAAIGIRASIDAYIDAEDVEVAHEPPLAKLHCSESDASDALSDHAPVVTTAEALRCCIQLRSYFIRQDQDTSQDKAQLNKLIKCVRQRKVKTAKQRNVDFSFKPVETSS